jgi:hypothetical protein
VLIVDGSVKPRQPSSGVEGIIRKGDGNFIFPFAKKISFVLDPFLAELRAVFDGPRCCLSLGYKTVAVQIDSAQLV